MENEKNKKYGLKIFCIFFQNWNAEESKHTLETIAEIGGTELLRANSLDALYKVFDNISETVQKTFVLKSDIYNKNS